MSVKVLDYVQYYLDLMAANQRDQAEWQPEYNLSSYYGLNEVSPASLNSLAESFITLEGRPLFDRPWTTITQPTPTKCNGNLSTPLDQNIPTDTNKVQREPIYSLGPKHPNRHQQGATGTYLLPWTKTSQPTPTRYYRANSVRLHHNSDPRACDSSCAYNHYCAITQLDYTDFRGCLETEPSAFSSRATLQSDSSATTILLCAFTTIGTVSVFHIS
uniref:Sphingomyelin phosphodiesterase C-terminal domain-containing protein n=1 Tax=Timema poppense TaxID=170557 RepID=A0A7R9CUW7_TIMPO|nr:unnamed protein product [Timema poppensis]